MGKEKNGIWGSSLLNSRIKSANVQNSERWLGYFVGPGMLYIAYFVVAGTYLNVFYTDVVKVGGLWGGLFLTLMPFLSKLLDVVTNIVMGRIVDHTRNLQGKARPWVFIAGPLIAVAGILMYAVPESSDLVKMIWIVITYKLYFAFSFTIYNMSHTLMVPLSTRNTRQRDGLALFNNMGTAMLPGALVYMLFPLLALPWMGVDKSRWLTVMTIFSIICIPAVLLEYYFTKERITEDARGKGEAENVISLKQQMGACFSDRYWIIMLAFYLVWQIYNNWQSTSLVYYCNWVLGTYNDGSTQTIVNAVGQAPLGLGVFLLWPIARKLGKQKTTILGMTLSIIGCIIGFLQPRSMGMVLISLVIRSFGLLPTYLMAAMLAEAMDHVEWKSGFRCDGFSASVASITITIGMGVAIGLFNLGLSITGYTAPAADGSWSAQSAGVQSYLIFGYFIVPLITYAIVLVLMLFFDVEKHAAQVQADIIARHKAEAEARGEVYMSIEERAAKEQEEQDRIAEVKRIEELKEKCRRKGLNFEEEEAKYQAKKAAKEAKKR
ncbi:MAG: MFS transporter [Blautia sp.]|nr:MFS transporter [Blautia sp.]